MSEKKEQLIELCKKTSWGIVYIAILFLPLVFVDGVYAKFDFAKMVLFYAATILLLVLFLLAAVLEGKVSLPRSKLLFVYALFLLAMLISTLLSIHPWTSIMGRYLRWSNGLFQYLAVGIWLVALTALADEKFFKTMWRLLFISSALVVIYAVMQSFGFDPVYFNQSQERVTSTLGEPTLLACFLVFLFPLSFWQMLREDKATVKFAFWLLSIGILFGILYSYSRAAWMAAAMALFFLLVILLARQKAVLRKRANIMLLGTFALLALVIFAFSFFNYQSDTQNYVDLQERDKAVVARLTFWKEVPKLWLEHPLFGSGPDTFGYVFGPVRPVSLNDSPAWAGYADRAHNEYLDRLATTGLVGMLAYLALLGYLAALLWTNFHTNTYSTSLLASLLGLSAAIFFSFNSIISWFLLTLTMADVIQRDQNLIRIDLKLDKFGRLCVSGLATIFLLLGSFYLAKYVVAERYAYKGHQLAKYDHNYGKAIEYLTKAYNLDPSEADYQRTISWTYFQKNAVSSDLMHENNADDIAAGIYYGELAQDTLPYLSEYPQSLGTELLNAAVYQPSLYELALEQFERAIEIEPTKPSFHALKALSLLGLGEDQLAEDTFLYAVFLKPDLPATYVHLGELYMSEGRLDEAGEQFTKARELDFSDSSRLQQDLENLQEKQTDE